jgi:hypothetical protein
VASEWSALEFAFQCAMVVVSQVPFAKIVALTAPTPMNGWIDILSNLLRQQANGATLPKDLTGMFERIKVAQRDRNAIVHAVWSNQFPSDLQRKTLRASDMAYGTGFPKKGQKLLVHQQYTAKQIRQVAMNIRGLADEFRTYFWPPK